MRTLQRAFLVRFLLFLLHPEDSTNLENLRDRRPHLAQFDNRLGGALKIGFWIVAVILFWTIVPTLCGHLKRHYTPSHRAYRAPLARPITPTVDTEAVIYPSTGISTCTDYTGNESLLSPTTAPSASCRPVCVSPLRPTDPLPRENLTSFFRCDSI